LKYKGNYIDFQRVRAKKKPKIEVVDSGPSTNPMPTQIPTRDEGVAGTPREPTWSMQVISRDGEIVEFDGFNLNYQEAMGLVFLFDLPLLITGKHVNLQVSQNLIALSVGKIYSGKYQLPLEMNSERTEALFLTNTRQLRVRVYLQLPEEQDQTEFDGLEPIGTVESGEGLLTQNWKKVQEHQIEIQSSLLNDIL